MLKNEALKKTNLKFEQHKEVHEITDKASEAKTHFAGAICPNCGARLEARKCKLLCPTRGCGYLVTCSEW